MKDEPSSESEKQTLLGRMRHTMRILATAMRDPALSGGCPLMGELFEVIAEVKAAEPLVCAVPEWKIPGLLLSAALLFQASQNTEHPLAPYLPDAASSRPIDDTFRDSVRRVLVENADSLVSLMGQHTYQCNPPRRMAVSLLAIAAVTQDWEAHPAVHVDIGTASGIGLLLGQGRANMGKISLGTTNPEMEFPVELRDTVPDMNAWKCPEIESSVGIDLDPPNLEDATRRAWMRACQFTNSTEWAYFDRAVELFLARRPRIERGSATDVLPRLAETLPEGQPLIVTDTYVTIFMSEEDRERMRCELDRIAQSRPVVWISNNPVVPLGSNPDRTTAGTPIPAELVERNRHEMFGAVCATTWPGGKRMARLLGVTHPGGCWFKWMD